jgi:hypothetical protein
MYTIYIYGPGQPYIYIMIQVTLPEQHLAVFSPVSVNGCSITSQLVVACTTVHPDIHIPTHARTCSLLTFRTHTHTHTQTQTHIYTQVLVTTREMPMQLPSPLTKLASIPLQTTWNDAGEGFVYVKSDLIQVSEMMCVCVCVCALYKLRGMTQERALYM